MKTDFKIDTKNRGFSFGASREAFQNVYMETKPKMIDPNIPGPGKYDIKSFVDITVNDNKNFTLSQKEHFGYGKYLLLLII